MEFETNKYISGMIEEVKEKMLFDISSTINLNNGCIVELGCYLGKSTSSILNGIYKNPEFKEKVKLHVFDLFQFNKKEKELCSILLKDCKDLGLTGAIIEKKKKS